MTLEQLDAAFEEGVIRETTLITEAGTNQLQPLYVVAGLDPPTVEPVAPATVPPLAAVLDAPPPPTTSKVPLPSTSTSVPRPAAPVPRPGAPRPEQPRKRSPSFVETAEAVVAEAGTAKKKSSPPPLPANAFAHLAAQAI